MQKRYVLTFGKYDQIELFTRRILICLVFVIIHNYISILNITVYFHKFTEYTVLLFEAIWYNGYTLMFGATYKCPSSALLITLISNSLSNITFCYAISWCKRSVNTI